MGVSRTVVSHNTAPAKCQVAVVYQPSEVVLESAPLVSYQDCVAAAHSYVCEVDPLLQL